MKTFKTKISNYFSFGKLIGNVLSSKLLLYAILSALIVIAYGLILSGLSLVFSGVIRNDNPWLMGLVIFILALLFAPIRNFIETRLGSVFFVSEKEYPERIQAFSGKLTEIVETQEIIQLLRTNVMDVIKPDLLHIFTYDTVNDQYRATPGQDGKVSSDLHFLSDSPIVKILTGQKGPVLLDSIEGLFESNSDLAKLQILGTQVLAPLSGSKRLAGWLAFNTHSSHSFSNPKELNFLDALCDQAALAIERSQVVARLENRMREMDILTRVSQGINITLNLDDILELVYAQTIQIIPADDFQIVLQDPETGHLVKLFYVEDSERLMEEEGFAINVPALEEEVIRLRRSISTSDYSAECQRLGIKSYSEEINSWIGFPLNAGAETIGVLSVAIRGRTIEYSNEKIILVQSITDQAAGAIVKARLLEETELHTMQLSKLNEISRQITSTLEFEPLLNTILNSATEILNCEAGSLVLVDEQTQELVFRVVSGPVAKDMQDIRLPLESGLVGKSIKERQPIIVSDVQNTPEWYSLTDQKTGFTSRSLLVIPLEVKDQVIGAIEVLNKQDGSPFKKEDQDLLMAFATQAAVVIENARLYTNTDQALAARVEELSIMQRIVRELNNTLDTSQAMTITLEWVMRQTRAAAGFAGIIQDHGIRILAHQGYNEEIKEFKDNIIAFNELNLEGIEDYKQPYNRSSLAFGFKNLLGTAHSQTIIPIVREKLIGVMFLEYNTTSSCSEDILNFLGRLSDHAAIAISNAQLYAAVQAANIAKSEFVSFVSHELKNPMTSIKGYSELLAAGAVGPINDGQANFLTTIRSNVDRMSTLVSDLADVSRIEAGRLKLEFSSVKINDAVEEVVRSLKRLIEDKKQKLNIQIPEDLSCVWADHFRLVQILTNLVSNACKYTPQEGDIYLLAKECNNIWDSKGAEKVVHLQVKDNGIGISAEDQKKIFQKFFRSDDPRTGESPGTGLGLNITKSLIEFQGGQIWFESEIGRGSTFNFTLPVHQLE